MRRADVLDGNLELRSCGVAELRRIFVQKTFDGLARFGIAGAAVIRLEFEAVENRRIVAGGNHHAADGAQMFDGEGNRRRRRRFRREDDLKIVAGQNFGGDLREAVGEKPAVIADDGFQFTSKDFRLRTSDFRLPIVRRRLRDARDIGKVKSSAMTARQPSVPNLICATRKDWQKKIQLPSAEAYRTVLACQSGMIWNGAPSEAGDISPFPKSTGWRDHQVPLLQRILSLMISPRILFERNNEPSAVKINRTARPS